SAPGPRCRGPVEHAPIRPRDRGRRNVSKCGGKKATHTPIQTILHVDGPTSSAVTALGNAIGRRSSACGDAKVISCVPPSYATARDVSLNPTSCTRLDEAHWCTPTNGSPIAPWERPAVATAMSITRPDSGNGPATTTATGFARCITTRWKGAGPDYATSFDPFAASIINTSPSTP